MSLTNEDLIAMGISSMGTRKSILSQADTFRFCSPTRLTLSPTLDLLPVEPLLFFAFAFPCVVALIVYTSPFPSPPSPLLVRVSLALSLERLDTFVCTHEHIQARTHPDAMSPPDSLLYMHADE